MTWPISESRVAERPLTLEELKGLPDVPVDPTEAIAFVRGGKNGVNLDRRIIITEQTWEYLTKRAFCRARCAIYGNKRVKSEKFFAKPRDFYPKRNCHMVGRYIFITFEDGSFCVALDREEVILRLSYIEGKDVGIFTHPLGTTPLTAYIGFRKKKKKTSEEKAMKHYKKRMKKTQKRKARK